MYTEQLELDLEVTDILYNTTVRYGIFYADIRI